MRLKPHQGLVGVRGMSYIRSVGLKDIRSRALEAIKAGCIQHEVRANINEKNLLQTGEVTIADVTKAINACRGEQYEERDHHQISSVKVHLFKPAVVTNDKQVRWYIKLYFLEDDPDVIFISVHH